MYKHYIRVNDRGEVIAAFSSAFQDPQEGDILVAETDERHFSPELTVDGVARYTWDGKKLSERSAAEIEALAAPVRERAEILAKLAALDVVVQRSVEDLYTAVGKQPHAKVKAAIDEKATLRARLAAIKSKGHL